MGARSDAPVRGQVHQDMSAWACARDLVWSMAPGAKVRRSDWIAKMESLGVFGSKVETYRLYLTRAGYLDHTGYGEYTRSRKRMSKGLTVRGAYRQAYSRELCK